MRFAHGRDVVAAALVAKALAGVWGLPPYLVENVVQPKRKTNFPLGQILVAGLVMA